MNQVTRKLRETIIFPFCESVLDDDILSLDPSKLARSCRNASKRTAMPEALLLSR
jgi:hypothetical protein